MHGFKLFMYFWRINNKNKYPYLPTQSLNSELGRQTNNSLKVAWHASSFLGRAFQHCYLFCWLISLIDDSFHILLNSLWILLMYIEHINVWQGNKWRKWNLHGFFFSLSNVLLGLFVKIPETKVPGSQNQSLACSLLVFLIFISV